MNSTNSKVETYKANIDSFNILSPDLLTLFFHKDEYKVIKVHPSDNADKMDHYYRKYFGKSLYNRLESGKRVCPFIEVYVVHSEKGATFTVKLHNRSKGNSYVAEFAGLTGYSKKSEQQRIALCDILDEVQRFSINRIDISIDFDGELPQKVETALLNSNRVAEIFKNTTYYNRIPKSSKTKKRKIDPYVNILSYSKTKKNNTEELSAYENVTRIEFQFRSSYTNKTKVKDIDILFEKIKKYILETAGISIKISKFNQKEEITTVDEKDFSANENIIRNIIRSELSRALKEMVPLVTKSIKSMIRKEFSLFANKIKNIQLFPVKYASTKYIAALFDLDQSFFNKRKSKRKNIFLEGTHYYRPEGESIIRWDINAVERWLQNKEEKPEIDDELENLIKRTVK